MWLPACLDVARAPPYDQAQNSDKVYHLRNSLGIYTSTRIILLVIKLVILINNNAINDLVQHLHKVALHL